MGDVKHPPSRIWGKLELLSLALGAIFFLTRFEGFRALRRLEQPTAHRRRFGRRHQHWTRSKHGEQDEDLLLILEPLGFAMPVQVILLNLEVSINELEYRMADQISLSSSPRLEIGPLRR